MIRYSLNPKHLVSIAAAAIVPVMLLPGCSNVSEKHRGAEDDLVGEAQVVYCLVDLQSGDVIDRNCVAEKMIEKRKIRQEDAMFMAPIIGKAVKNDLGKGAIIQVSDLAPGAPRVNKLSLSEEGSEKLMNIARAKGLSGPQLATDWVVEKLKVLKDPVAEADAKKMKEVEALEQEEAAASKATDSEQKKADSDKQ